MQIIKNNRGYTLLITVAIIVLFTVLGMSLITLTSSGIKKNESRENNVQATSLAEKGITYINNQINKELTDSIGTGIPRNTFIDNLNKILNSYTCDNTKDISLTDHGISKTGSTGSYNVCIDQISDSFNNDGSLNELSKLVKFRSTGKANTKEKILHNYFIIGSDSIPEALKYAVGAFIDQSDANSKKNDGNLFLLGGSDITGDLKVEGNLISSNTAYIYSSGSYGITNKYTSSFSSSKSLNTAKKSKITVGKNLYLFNSTNPTNYLDITRERTFSNSKYKKKDNIEDLFFKGYSPSLIKGYTNATSVIPVDTQISNDLSSRRIDQYTAKTIKSDSIENQTFPDSSIKYQYESCSWSSCSYKTNIPLTLMKNNSFKNLYIYNNLTLSSASLETYESSFINGDLNIKGNSSIRGVYYINGSVNIENSNLSSNAILYVKGDVKVSESKLSGIRIQNNKTGSLIIFANNNINFTNISNDKSEPSEINGFFYSNKNLHLGGVQSNIKLIGGISAKNIDLNAIRGDKKNPSSNINIPSRLQIIYNQDIIETYSNLKQNEPFVFNINPSFETNREN